MTNSTASVLLLFFFCSVLQMSWVVAVMDCRVVSLLLVRSTAELSRGGASCCAVVRAAHKLGAWLWQTFAHFTLTASVFTVINQWWPGGCHFAPCGARPRLGSAPQTHSRPWWGHRATHTRACALTRTHKNYMLSIRQTVGAITETWQNTMKQAPLSEGK